MSFMVTIYLANVCDIMGRYFTRCVLNTHALDEVHMYATITVTVLPIRNSLILHQSKKRTNQSHISILSNAAYISNNPKCLSSSFDLIM